MPQHFVVIVLGIDTSLGGFIAVSFYSHRYSIFILEVEMDGIPTYGETRKESLNTENCAP